MFRLEPHHLPPGCEAPLEAPADATCEVEWEGHTRTVLLRAVRVRKLAWLVFGKMEGDNDPWIVTQWPSRLPKIWRRCPSPSKLLRIPHRNRLVKMFPKVHLFCDATIERGPQCVLMMPDREWVNGAWGMWLDRKLGTATAFELETTPVRDCGEWYAAWKVEFQFSDSDIRFAWEWAQWSDAEQRVALTGFRGDFDEFQELKCVMRWVLFRLASRWHLDIECIWQLHPAKEVDWSMLGRKYEGDQNLLDLWQQWLRHYYFPAWQGNWGTEHICVRQCSMWLALHEIKVEMSGPPTMHEQMEARLQLRAWLQDKATPEEIEKLMAG